MSDSLKHKNKLQVLNLLQRFDLDVPGFFAKLSSKLKHSVRRNGHASKSVLIFSFHYKQLHVADMDRNICPQEVDDGNQMNNFRGYPFRISILVWEFERKLDNFIELSCLYIGICFGDLVEHFLWDTVRVYSSVSRAPDFQFYKAKVMLTDMCSTIFDHGRFTSDSLLFRFEFIPRFAFLLLWGYRAFFYSMYIVAFLFYALGTTSGCRPDRRR